VNPAYYSSIYMYLRSYRAQAVARPDYFLAQRIDDVIGEILLKQNQSDYSETKNWEVDRLEEKLEIARDRLEDMKSRRDKAKQEWQERKEEALERLRYEQEEELRVHDDRYAGEMVLKFRHLSQEILQLREQERFLRQSKRYLEAQALMEESQALEAYHWEVQRLNWEREGESVRELLIQKHNQQRKCLIEKFDRDWSTRDPLMEQHVKHFETVIDHLEKACTREKSDRREVELKTRQMLRRRPGLPKLGRSLPRAPMRRVTTVNTHTNFTYGIGRPSSKPRTSLR
jgi:hypothetical protein